MRTACPVTAVVPTFNRAELLGRAIDSALNQTVPPSQVVVVDDGSTDGTAEICAKYGDRVEYVAQQNAGPSASRNRGFWHARQPWVAFLDSDDYWNPPHLERIMAAIAETHGTAAVYFADMQLPTSEGGGTLWERINFHPRAPHHLVADATGWMLIRRQPTMLQSSVISRAALERVGGLDARFRLVHDTHIFCALGIGGVACAVAGVGCVQTADDPSPVRLTVEVPIGSPRQVAESSVLWLERLQNLSAVRPEFRRVVRYNAASYQWELSRNLLRAGRYGQGLKAAATAIAVDPSFALWMLRHRTRKGYDATVRPVAAETAPVSSVPGVRSCADG